MKVNNILDGNALETYADYVDICISLVKYVHEENFDAVIFIDKSARMAYLGFLKIWHKMFHGEIPPKIFFLNPHANQQDLKYISGYEEWKVLIFDTCSHSGWSINRTKQILDKSFGIPQPYVGLAQESTGPLNPDFIALGHEPCEQCYPFGREWKVKKSKDIFCERIDHITSMGNWVYGRITKLLMGFDYNSPTITRHQISALMKSVKLVKRKVIKVVHI